MVIYVILEREPYAGVIIRGPFFSSKEKAETFLKSIKKKENWRIWIEEHQPKGETIFVAEEHFIEPDEFSYAGIFDDYKSAEIAAGRSDKRFHCVSTYKLEEILDKKE